jgi:hypothetical protein
VALTHSQSQQFAKFWIEHATGERAAEAEIALQNGGRVGHDFGEVGDHLHFGLNGSEQFFGLSRSGALIENW